MIFTATQVLRSQTSSQEFKAYGAENLAPAVVSASRIVAFPTDPHGFARRQVLGDHFNRMVAIRAGLTVGETFLSSAVASKHHLLSEKLFSIPDAVSTMKNPTETTIAKFVEAGYRKVTSGRYQYFQGPSAYDSMKKVAALGGEIYSFAPAEKVSIGGASAAVIIRRLLFYAFNVTCENFDVSQEFLTDTLPKDMTHPIQFAEDSRLTGHFLPYFDGLLIPDKDIIIRFMTLFTRNLGDNAGSIKNTTTILLRGWTSLAFTSSGKKASHMMFVLSLAVEGGFRTRPVFTRGEYVGMLLIGNGTILKGAEVYTPDTAKTLTEEIRSISGHDNALIEIAELISGVPIFKTGAISKISADDLTTPRRIHIELAKRKFSPETEVAITKQLPFLRFKQKFFEISDDSHLAQVLTAMGSKKSALDPDAPCDYLGGHMFTRKKILSALLAFGPLAPAPQIAAGSNVSVRVSSSLPTANHSGGHLGGIPLFIRPIQEAYEEWTSVKKNGTISFFSRGKDRNGRMKVRNLARSVTVDDPLSKQVLAAYVKLAGKKRKRDADEDEPEQSEKTTRFNDEARKAKKVRVNEETEGLFAGMGWEDPEAMEE